MSIKLLFFIVLSLLLSSCYTHFGYVYTEEPVDEVYIYGVNYVYANLWYDDFYWQYNTGYYCDFGLYSPEYYQYSYYYKYNPYYKKHRPKFKRQWSNRQEHNFVKKHHVRRSTMDRPNIRKNLRGQNIPYNVPIKSQNKRNQIVTERKRNNISEKKTIVRQRQQNNSPKIRRSTPRNNSPKRSVPKRSNSVKSSTKKGRR
jgi:hypothetical protein